MSQAKRVWFITGISRGLGRELAQGILDEGGVVVGTTRSGKADLDPGAGELHVLAVDVNNVKQVNAAVEKAHGFHWRLDVVVNNAGYGLLGAVEEVELAQARQVFDTNFFGSLNVIRAALPFLRAQRRGHIVNVSSVGGFCSVAGAGLYSASKFALEGMSESLAQELAPLGIRVTIVEPGAFRTDFLTSQSLHRATQSIDDYEATSGKMLAHFTELDGKQQGDPAAAARAIIDVISSPSPPLRLALGSDALDRMRRKLAQVATELDRWESTSLSTSYAEAVH